MGLAIPTVRDRLEQFCVPNSPELRHS